MTATTLMSLASACSIGPARCRDGVEPRCPADARAADARSSSTPPYRRTARGRCSRSRPCPRSAPPPARRCRSGWRPPRTHISAIARQPSEVAARCTRPSSPDCARSRFLSSNQTSSPSVSTVMNSRCTRCQNGSPTNTNPMPLQHVECGGRVGPRPEHLEHRLRQQAQHGDHGEQQSRFLQQHGPVGLEEQCAQQYEYAARRTPVA